MKTTEISYTEISNGTRVRTLVPRRRQTTEGWIDIPAGVEGRIISCTHAGFNGRIHSIRLDNGLRVGSYSANEVTYLAPPAR
jgi:hypothetical protein